MRFLPLFPLQIVAFPYEKLNLHIFEPRYKQLITECAKENTTFGIVAFIDNKLQMIGTEMRLAEITKQYPNGEMDIRTEGVGLFEIVDFYNQAVGKMYPAAHIKEVAYSIEGGDFFLKENILTQVAELHNILNINKKIDTQSANFSTFDLAHHVGFSLEQEYQFLTLPSEIARQEYMNAYLEKCLPFVREIEHLKERARLNGHFKHIQPPNIGDI